MLPRSRIPRSTEVLDIIQKGKTLSWGPFTFKVTKASNSDTPSRFAIVLAKKYYKKAVTRNKIKRKLFGILKEFQTDLPHGFDVVILTRGGIDVLSPSECRIYFEKLLESLH